MGELIGQFVIWLLSLSPAMAPILGVLALMGTVRAVMKLVMTFLTEVVKVTPSHYDDELLASWQKSKTYTAVAYLLDWLASIKLPSKVTNPSTKE